MDSIDGLATILKAEVGRWEEVVFAWACDLARRLAELLLQKADQELMNSREGGLKVEGFRERWVTTLFGDIRIKRRLYSDGEGGSRFPLDEDMGLRKRSQASPKVEEVATFLSTLLPLGKCEQVLRALLPDGLSHTTIHRLVGRTVDPHIQEEEAEMADLFGEDYTPEMLKEIVDKVRLNERAYDYRCGLRREDEMMPNDWYEPITTRKWGTRVFMTRKIFEQMKTEHYTLRGNDPVTGAPGRETRTARPEGRGRQAGETGPYAHAALSRSRRGGSGKTDDEGQRKKSSYQFAFFVGAGKLQK